MSYILDALKKSDQERQQGASPSLQTVHRPHANHVERSWLYLLSVLVVVLLLAVAGLVAWSVFDFNTVEVSKPEQKSASEETITSDRLKQPDTSEAVVIATPTTSATEQPSAWSTTASKVVVPFSQLPLAVRNNIPAMTFSFHVYSENPDRRTIIINGRRVKQGAVIDSQLLLDEITPNGVIFSWQDYQFSIPVVEAW